MKWCWLQIYLEWRSFDFLRLLEDLWHESKRHQFELVFKFGSELVSDSNLGIGDKLKSCINYDICDMLRKYIFVSSEQEYAGVGQCRLEYRWTNEAPMIHFQDSFIVCIRLLLITHSYSIWSVLWITKLMRWVWGALKADRAIEPKTIKNRGVDKLKRAKNCPADEVKDVEFEINGFNTHTHRERDADQ